MVPSTIDSPIWGMMMSVGMISFPTSPQVEARAGRKHFIIYKRELEARVEGERIRSLGMAPDRREIASLPATLQGLGAEIGCGHLVSVVLHSLAFFFFVTRRWGGAKAGFPIFLHSRRKFIEMREQGSDLPYVLLA